MDTLRYQFEYPGKAFDTLFKLYQVFKARYPLPGEHIYLLIQRCVYKVRTPFDSIHPYLVDLLNELE